MLLVVVLGIECFLQRDDDGKAISGSNGVGGGIIFAVSGYVYISRSTT